jgi:hypothetical protein
MNINWARLLLAAAVSLVVFLLLAALIKPAAIGVLAGLYAALWVAQISGPWDGSLVGAAALLPAGLFYGYQSGQGYLTTTGLSEFFFLILAAILGAAAYAVLGGLIGAFTGLMVRLGKAGKLPFF